MAKKPTGIEARVRDDSRWPTVTAFGGREYVRGVWRPVPDEQAGSAAAHPFLEVRAAGVADEVGRQESAEVGRQESAEVGRQESAEVGRQESAEVGRQESAAVDTVDVVEEPPAPETDTETDKDAPPAPMKGKKRGQL